MKRYAGKEIDVLVEPFSESKSHYVIYYRITNKFHRNTFNLFNSWKRLEYTWHLSVQHFDGNQPRLYNRFEDALAEAHRLKADPSLIDKNEERRLTKLKEHREEYAEYLKSRDKRIKI